VIDDNLGHLLTFMLRHREARLGSGTRKSHPGELDVAKALDDLDIQQWDVLGKLAEAFGFKLEIVEGGPGRPEIGERTFLFLRNPQSGMPEFGGSHSALEAMKRQKNETQQTARTWWIFIWSHHMALLYDGRSLTEVSRFTGADFRREHLVGLVMSGIDTLSRIDVAPDKRAIFAQILLEVDPHREVQIRVDSFLMTMTEAGLLEQVGDDVFRQTLLAAKEAAHSVEIGLGDLFEIPLEDPVEGTLNLATVQDPNANIVGQSDSEEFD
jgi:hypothetical protein|tara:strand:- start:150 stop:953 length:804 start_codon:yes stop_codon:yes gene_type:complete